MLLTVIYLTSSQNYNIMKLTAMTSYLDFLIIIIYNYANFWDNITKHQVNLYSFTDNSDYTLFSTDVTVKDYIKFDISADKIIMSMLLYSCVFKHMNNMSKYFYDVDKDSFENDIWDYKVLLQTDTVE